ncbi:MAG: glycosyltransferase family 1 protein [Bacteroidia bacterium]
MASSERHLNIVSFDVPYPPTYGGVIDVFYKIKALYEKGIKIHLHCFQYGRERSEALEKLCHKTNYYPRNIAKSQLFNKLPYIVISRSSGELLKNISENNFPVLFEGLHACYYLNDKNLGDRKKIVRTHNIEHDYYNNLAKVESNLFKRYYFYNEAGKLDSYESILSSADFVAAISINDADYFQTKYNNAFYLPAFHANEQVKSHTGKGHYAFYHGNLSIGENNAAALWLVNEVFPGSNVQLIIAGHRPSEELQNAVEKLNNVTLISDVNAKQLHQLIADAHVNILPTFQPTGIKLKLLTALFNGRFCLVNPPMIENTGLEKLCSVADSPKQMKEELSRLFKIDHKASDIKLKEKILSDKFSNKTNIEKLLTRLYGNETDLFSQL